MTRVIFGEFQPDQPANLSEGLTVADGCFAIKNGYAPIGSFTPTQNGTLTGGAYGAGAYRYAGQTYVFAANPGAIYRYTATGYVTLATGLSNGLGVRFAPYSSLMLATNGADVIRKFDPAAPGTMANLGGSPPTARYIGVVGGFTVLAYASNVSTRVAWSDQGNPENWTAGGASEAGVADMATGGDITGFVGGEYGLIFQENRVVRMSYTASDTIWQFDEIATDIGCVLPGSIATWGKLTFFMSNRGFMVCDGSTVTPVGAEKIDRWFLSVANRQYFDRVSAVIDPRNALYILTMPTAYPASMLLLYSYTLGRWSTASTRVEYIASGIAQDATLEGISAMYPNLDAMPLSLDSPLFRGGTPLLLMFDDSHRLGALNGPPLPAAFADAQRELIQGRRARIRSVRPITDAAAPVVTIAGGNSFAAALTPTTYMGRQPNGRLPTRENWNLVQVSLGIPSQPWTYAQGFDLEIEQGGTA